MEEIYSAWKVEQINDYLFIDTYNLNNIKVGVNDMTVNDSEMCVRWVPIMNVYSAILQSVKSLLSQWIWYKLQWKMCLLIYEISSASASPLDPPPGALPLDHTGGKALRPM